MESSSTPINDLEGAAHDLGNALQLYTDIPIRPSMANALDFLGVIASSRGKYRNAVRFGRMAYRLHGQMGTVWGESNAAGVLAIAHLGLNEVEDARRYAYKAVELGTRCHNTFAIESGQSVLKALSDG